MTPELSDRRPAVTQKSSVADYHARSGQPEIVQQMESEVPVINEQFDSLAPVDCTGHKMMLRSFRAEILPVGDRSSAVKSPTIADSNPAVEEPDSMAFK